ncbi:MAG: rhodanese-like domain-containing protein [Gammaproteobacteria bacterium]
MEQFGEFVTNHWILFTALALVLMLLVNDLAGGIGRAVKEVSPQQAVQLINRDGAAILDVREPKDFQAGHIVGAINIPEAKIPERLRELEPARERPLLLYCSTGMVSGRAGSLLKKNGFGRLYSLRGGISAWRQENFPVARD